MNITLILTILFIALAILLSVYILLLSKVPKESQEWRKKVIKRLSQLNLLITTENNEIRKNALVEADKLLDHALKKLNRPGKTMSERLKNSKRLFSKDLYSSIRVAHRIRNQIVHEFDFKIQDKDVIKHFNSLKKAIREIL